MRHRGEREKNCKPKEIVTRAVRLSTTVVRPSLLEGRVDDPFTLRRHPAGGCLKLGRLVRLVLLLEERPRRGERALGRRAGKHLGRSSNDIDRLGAVVGRVNVRVRDDLRVGDAVEVRTRRRRRHARRKLRAEAKVIRGLVRDSLTVRARKVFVGRVGCKGVE